MGRDLSARRSLIQRLRSHMNSLSRDPKNPEVLQQMAEILIQLDRNAEALSCMLSAAQRFADQKRPREAVEACQKILVLDPGDTDARQLLEQLGGDPPAPPPAAGPAQEAAPAETLSAAGVENVVVVTETADGFQQTSEVRIDIVEEEPPEPPPEESASSSPWNPLGQQTVEVDEVDVLAEEPESSIPQARQEQGEGSTPPKTGQGDRPPAQGPGIVSSVTQQVSAALSEPGSAQTVVELGLEHRHDPADDELRIAQVLDQHQVMRPRQQALPLPDGFRDEGRRMQVEEGAVIYSERDRSNELFLLIRGKVVLTKAIKTRNSTIDPNPRVVTLEAESCFGVLALLGDGRRHLSARALEPCELLLFTKRQIKDLMKASPPVNRAMRELYRIRLQETAVHSSQLFMSLPDEAARAFFRRGKPRRCKGGELVIREGDQSDGFYLVLLGTMEVTRSVDGETSVLLHRLGDGDFFGGISLLMDKAYPATVRARNFVQLLFVPPEAFFRFGSEHPELLVAVDSEAQRRAVRYDSIMAGEAQYEVGTTVFLLDKKKPE
jgi:CRP-like cAMP-binding protein